MEAIRLVKAKECVNNLIVLISLILFIYMDMIELINVFDIKTEDINNLA